MYRIIISTTVGMPQFELDCHCRNDRDAITYAENVTAQMEGVRWFLSASLFKAGDENTEPTLMRTFRLKVIVS